MGARTKLEESVTIANDNPSEPTSTAVAASVASAERGFPSEPPSALPSQLEPTVPKPSIMGPAVLAFEDAVVCIDAQDNCAREMRRASFINGVEAFATVLDKMGGNMGSYLVANTKKM